MARVHYRDLAEFGLYLITPEDAPFAEFAREIAGRPAPFRPTPPPGSGPAAVLVNGSGKAVVSLGFVWLYTTTGGQTRISYFGNLGSSMQLEVLSGVVPVRQDPFSFILPGSKRLITEDGMFGDNRDVLPPQPFGGGGFVGSGAGSARARGSPEEISAIELVLDLAIFEDGLCAGPDELGRFDSIASQIEQQRSTAREIAGLLRGGGTAGQAFEGLRPLARRTRPEGGPGRRAMHEVHLLHMFASMAIHQLTDVDGPELAAWFERYAGEPSVRLHRPEG